MQELTALAERILRESNTLLEGWLFDYIYGQGREFVEMQAR